jgi:hypothetical protein
VRLSRGLNPKRSESLNRMVTLLPGEQWRSRRNPVGKLLEQRWAHGFYVTMTVSAVGASSSHTLVVTTPRQPTQNSRPKFRFPLNQHNIEPAHLLTAFARQLFIVASVSDTTRARAVVIHSDLAFVFAHWFSICGY